MNGCTDFGTARRMKQINIVGRIDVLHEAHNQSIAVKSSMF